MSRFFAVLFLLAAFLGLVFASLSTSDFVQHLDREVHAIHCSFIPGLAPTTDASSGCHVALMSPWSSVFRTWVWGGLPVALPGMAVFAFLIFRVIELWVVRGLADRAATLFLFVVTLLPVLTSVFFAAIAISELGEFCRTCVGIYTASALCLIAVIGLTVSSWMEDPGAGEYEAPQQRYPRSNYVSYEHDSQQQEERPEPDGSRLRSTQPAGWFDHPVLTWSVGTAELVGFVLVAVLLYLVAVPDHSRFVGTCGSLPKPDDPNKVLISIGRARGASKAIEVFDPLCPACRGFEARLDSSGLGAELDRRALLFPLDNQCNWMITSAIHPGACTVSEAILCAEDDAQAVIDWAFEHQEEIREAAKDDPAEAKRKVIARFPELSKCVGSAKARQKLNQSLRWAVANQLPVLTPQLYVENQKLCDEDTDLGLDFALSRLLAREGR